MDVPVSINFNIDFDFSEDRCSQMLGAFCKRSNVLFLIFISNYHKNKGLKHKMNQDTVNCRL